MWQILLKRKIRRRWTLNALTLVMFFVAFTTTTFFIYQLLYADKIYKGVYVGPYDLGGKTYMEAGEFLEKKANEFLAQKMEFIAPEKQVKIDPIAVANDPGFSYSLVSYNIDETLNEVYGVGRKGNILKNIFSTFLLAFKKKDVSLAYDIDREALLGTLKENFGPFENPPKNAEIQLSFNDVDTPYVKIIPEKNGRIFDFENSLKNLESNVVAFEQKPIRLSLNGVSPTIKTKETNDALLKMDEPLKKLPLALTYGKQNWKILKNEFSKMIVFVKDENGKVVLGLDKGKIGAKIDSIGKQINIQPKNAQFTMRDGKVIEFQVSNKGQILDKEATIKKISETVFGSAKPDGKETKIELVINETAPEITMDSINEMGIKEIISVGESNFQYSPPNRRHNIANGTKKIHGAVIKPGETFSLVKAIGKVNAETGFKPELVIKGDKTTPEYGGGLCQIATTLFRAALNAGLEITERQNHSYRVSYYEPPAGMDATIYNPRPDLKFKNDTGHYILIQTEINGDVLKYTLWGTKDARVVEIGIPVISRITSPPPTKIVETTDLPVGTKKCTEKAHKGASAYFDYKITFADGKKTERKFISFYRPWQEVCLLGVAANSATTTAAIAP